MIEVHEPTLHNLTSLLDALTSDLRGLVAGEGDRHSLPELLAARIGAEWASFRPPGGGWIRAGPGSIQDPRGLELETKRIDFGVLDRLPRGRLLRLAGPVLDRSLRWVGTGIRELLVYLDLTLITPSGLAVMAIPGPLRVDPAQIEALLRVWMALAPVRAGLRRTAEQDRRLELGTRAACALHDLRHELTIVGLEIERASAERGPIPASGLEPIRSAFSRARALAEIDVESGAKNPEALVLVAEVLREEANAALSVAGRGKAVRIELRVAEGLAFALDRRMLSRIVRNLALNAVESSPDGERVSIEAEGGGRGELVLRVTDRGRGMSQADREDLFRFGRSGRGGWGVGSSSIESCARRIGATCSIESRLGAGTAVELRVPPASRTAGD